jgi:hypothetical protein
MHGVRWPAWVSGLLAVLGVAAAAVTAGVSSADKGLHAVVVLIATAVVAGVVPLVGSALGRSRERLELVARLTVGSDGGRLRRLGELELEVLGVRPPRTSTLRAREQLPYASWHELDPVLDAALAGYRFVLVHGPSATGKSRSTAQAARWRYGDHLLLVPVTEAGAVDQLLGSGVDLVGVVVWLDDLDRHLGAGLGKLVVLRLLQVPGLRIVATVRAMALEQYKEHGQIRSPGQEVIDLAHLVEFTGWDRTDRNQARQQLAGEPDIVTALEPGMGLAEYLSAGPELVNRLTLGEPPAAGVAVVHAAADWYRAGLTRPAHAQPRLTWSGSSTGTTARR